MNLRQKKIPRPVSMSMWGTRFKNLSDFADVLVTPAQVSGFVSSINS
jgi:hypothetical protein